MEPADVKVEGRVTIQSVAPGSKSERVTAVLTTKSGQTYVLRRQNGNPFRDDAVNALAGHSVKAEGVAAGGTLIMRSWQQID